MISDDRADKAANRFIEQLGDLDQPSSRKERTANEPAASPSHITINRAVRCTIVIGQAPDPHPQTRSRRGR